MLTLINNHDKYNHYNKKLLTKISLIITSRNVPVFKEKAKKQTNLLRLKEGRKHAPLYVSTSKCL